MSEEASKNQWRLICDKGREIPAKYLESCENYKVIKSQITTGDYAVRSPTGEYIYIIERKTYIDLMATLRNPRRLKNHNRLLSFREQHGAEVVYIIENFSRSSHAETFQSFIKGSPVNPARGLARSSAKDFLDSIMKEGCKVMFTTNPRDSARKIDELVNEAILRAGSARQSNKPTKVKIEKGQLPKSAMITEADVCASETCDKSIDELLGFAATPAQHVINISAQPQKTKRTKNAGKVASRTTQETPIVDFIPAKPIAGFTGAPIETQSEIPDAVDFNILVRYSIDPSGLNYTQSLELCDALSKLENLLRSMGKPGEFKIPNFSQNFSPNFSRSSHASSFTTAPIKTTIESELLPETVNPAPYTLPLINLDDDIVSVCESRCTNMTVLRARKNLTVDEIKLAAIGKLNGVTAPIAEVLCSFKVVDILLCKVNEYKLRSALLAAGVYVNDKQIAQIYQQDKASIIKFLDEIYLVTPSTAAIVYDSFKPFSAIFNASIADFETINKHNGKPIGNGIATNIYTMLRL